MAQDAGEIIDQLREKIREHDYLYYVLNRPKISDRQYDELFAELKSLEQANPADVSSGGSLEWWIPGQGVRLERCAGSNQHTHQTVVVDMIDPDVYVVFVSASTY